MSSIDSVEPFRSTADELRALRGAAAVAPPREEATLVHLDDPVGSPLEQAIRFALGARSSLAALCALVALAFVARAVALVVARYRRDALVPTAVQRITLSRAGLRRAAARSKHD